MGEDKSGIPTNLKGYHLEKGGGSLIKKLVVLIIIILIVLWFINREIVLYLYDWIKDLVASFF